MNAKIKGEHGDRVHNGEHHVLRERLQVKLLAIRAPNASKGQGPHVAVENIYTAEAVCNLTVSSDHTRISRAN
jgi:hypothetical protein